MGFYYLKSRYYDPAICRFINADGLASTGQGFLGYNMFAYCDNNPVNRADATGERPILSIDPDNETEEERKFSFAIMKGKVVDITEQLNSFMRTNAVYYLELLSFYRNIYPDSFELALFYAWNEFYEDVDNDGRLDIKYQDGWAFKPGYTYLYNGRILREDDPGNINFGFVGAVLFPEAILCFGAGINQIKKWGFRYGNLSTFFDDPRDNEMIKLGFAIYQQWRASNG